MEHNGNEARINLFATEIGADLGKSFGVLGQSIAQSTLPRATAELVNLRASQINGCAYCMDMHTKEAEAAGESSVRLHLVAGWREATVFTDAERAALALAEEGTRIADSHPGVSDDTWARVAEHFDDEQVATLVTLIAFINAANRINVIVRNPAGSYRAGMLAQAHA